MHEWNNDELATKHHPSCRFNRGPVVYCSTATGWVSELKVCISTYFEEIKMFCDAVKIVFVVNSVNRLLIQLTLSFTKILEQLEVKVCFSESYLNLTICAL